MCASAHASSKHPGSLKVGQRCTHVPDPCRDARLRNIAAKHLTSSYHKWHMCAKQTE